MKDYLTNIDELSVYNWRKCQEGDLTFTRKNKAGNKANDILAWELIMDSYYARFGLGKDFERVLELRKQIALFQCDFVINDDNFILNHIRRLEAELLELLNKKSEGDLTTALIHITKWIGSSVRERETTVLELYTMLGEMKKESDQIKKQQKTK